VKQVHEYLDPGKETKFENELGHRVWGWGGRAVQHRAVLRVREQARPTATAGKSGSKRSRGGHGVDARVRLCG
jgi:hypothetical protein